MKNKELFDYMGLVRDYFVDGPSQMSMAEYMKTILGRDEHKSINSCGVQSDIASNEKAITLSAVLAEETNYWNTSIWGPISSPSRIKKFIKRMIRKTIYWLIEPVFARQREFNRATAQALRDISELSNHLAQEKHVELALIKSLEDNIKAAESNLKTMLSDSDKRSAEMLRTFHEEVIKANSQTEKKMLYLENQIEKFNAETNKKISQNQIDMNYMNFKMRKLTRNITLNSPDSTHTAASDVQTENTAATNKYEVDYFAFENRFRGDEKIIKESQKMYLPYFAGKKNVVDVGCGRGEFLELLIENDISAVGVDLYPDFVEYCREKKLSVEQTDAVSYLKTCEDNSLGGIFAGQVIEHLSQEYLLELIDVAYAKLSFGSYFIAETPNPQLLLTFTNAFYLDMSHTKPVHPDTMRFLLESAGYLDVAVIYNERSKIDYRLPLLDAENVNNLAEFNNGVNLLSDLLFGYQDYTIVGRK